MRVSFVIPAHNASAWLPLAIKSAMDQTHKDIEIVIVDDKSTDATPDYLAWLEAQKDARVRIIRNTENFGRSASRNIGNEAATGGIICVLDADDLATPTRAAVTVSKMERTKADFVYGGARVIDAVGRNLGEIAAQPFDLAKATKTLLNGIVHSTVAYTKDLALGHPYPSGEFSDLGIDDWAHQMAVAKSGAKMEPILQVVTAYRHLSTGVSKTRDEEKVKAAKLAYLGLEPVGAA